jgi:tryptophan synthase alpha chain
MNRDRIHETFRTIEQEDRPGLILFLTPGFPDWKATRELVPALVEAGADAIELSIPFSDPLADGPIIQESTFLALERGVTPQDCLDAVSELRGEVPDTPLILMSYYNPILSYGLDRFAAAAQSAGVDGLIGVDVPHSEIDPLFQVCRPAGVHLIPMLAPTSTDASVRESAEAATGFIYCVSLTGITGARDQVSERSFDLLTRVRSHTRMPLALGFGISRREHVEAVCRQADAAAVGSALVRVMLESPRDRLVANAVALAEELSGRR